MEWITRMLRPPRAVLWSVVVSAAVLLTLCLNGTIAAPAVAYFAYLYSTYALVIFCVWIPSAVRRSRAFAFGRLRAAAGDSRAMRWLVALAEDADFRTRTMLVPSLLFNLAFAAVKLAAGVAMRSAWIIGVGVYYALLAGMRHALLRTFLRGGRDPEAEWRIYRNTALWLMLLTLAMGGLITQVVLYDQAYRYPGLLIYAFALYAFVKIIAATTALLRRRSTDDRLLAASRAIGFSCALMSMLALQTALIRQFDEGTDFGRTANALFGLAICVAMLVLCLHMLRRSARHAKEETA